jgi:hypothetical protein
MTFSKHVLVAGHTTALSRARRNEQFFGNPPDVDLYGVNGLTGVNHVDSTV